MAVWIIGHVIMYLIEKFQMMEKVELWSKYFAIVTILLNSLKKSSMSPEFIVTCQQLTQRFLSNVNKFV